MGCCGHDPMVVRVTITYVISAYHNKVMTLNPAHGEVYLIQHYVISLSVTCDRLMVFSEYSGVLHQ